MNLQGLEHDLINSNTSLLMQQAEFYRETSIEATRATPLYGFTHPSIKSERKLDTVNLCGFAIISNQVY